jgi:twitching motility protein PilT
MHTVDSLLRYLVDKGGSDLHILSGLPPAIRLDGKLTSVEGSGAMSPAEVEQMIYKALDKEQIEKFESDPSTRNELDFAYSIEGIGRFRFNIHRQRGTVGAVARALSSKIPSLNEIGVPECVWPLCDIKKGLVLVTGPTGSGKTTTLAAIINRLNESREEHILTIEDPIEYVHNSKKAYVTQREVGEGADTLSFKNALKYALRQDPDVILIGEMRDHETIGIAVTSAETGHLVFGTLHTSSASQTVARMIDVFPADQQTQIIVQIAQNLAGVISQILLPRSDTSGRVLAAEIMKVNAAIRNNIRGHNIDAIYQAIQTGSQEGMVTMDQSLANLIRGGEITFEVARPHIRDDITLRQLQQFAGASSSGPKTGANVPTNGPGVPTPRPQSASQVAVPPWEKQS